MLQNNEPFPGQSLTSVRFNSLLSRLDADRNRAGEKYEEIRRKLVKFFQWNFCATAEDLADETLDRVARKLDEKQEKIEVVRFIWGVARNIQREARKREAKTVHLAHTLGGRTVSDLRTATDAIQETIQNQQQFRCLNVCMERLPAEERRLLWAYRAGKEHCAEIRKGLAKKLAITPGALRVRIIRLREKLEKCMIRCLAY